jgi:hypothetical protein
MLAAFASKGKQDPAEDEELLDEGEQEIDDLDVAESTSEEDAEHEAEESPEFEAGEEEEAAEDEDEEEIDLDALVELVESGEGDEELLALALDIDEEANLPAWALDEDVWEHAKKAVEDRKAELLDYAAVVTHIYKAMGGEIAEASDEE